MSDQQNGHPKPWPDLVFAEDHHADAAVLSRAVQRGTLRRLARGIYTSLTIPPEQVVRKHLWSIVARLFPGAIIADRSVANGGIAPDGELYIIHSRRRPIELPGVSIFPRTGPGPQPADMRLPDGLWMSSEERALLDNLAESNIQRGRALPRDTYEEWLERLLQQRGPEGLNNLRDKARALAPKLHRQSEMRTLDQLIATALNTGNAHPLTSRALQARAAGVPYDKARCENFDELIAALSATPPDVLPALPVDEPRRAFLPFYEAYFSNFIEGTEFGDRRSSQHYLQPQCSCSSP